MKILIFLFFTIISLSLFAQQNEKAPFFFQSQKEDSIVLYDFNKVNDFSESIINKKTGKLSRIEKCTKADPKTAMLLSRKLDSRKSYGAYVAACFEPHLGIVYYKEGKIIAYINVCMDCNRLESNVKINAQNQGAKLAETGEVYYIRQGMSKSFRNYLNRLLIRYEFSHQNIRMPFEN